MTRKAVSAPLAALMLTLGVAAPFVELADLSSGPGIESEHHAGTCPAPHDHTVCTQLRAGHAAPAGDVVDLPVEVVRLLGVTDQAVRVRHDRRLHTRTARAPPSI